MSHRWPPPTAAERPPTEMLHNYEGSLVELCLRSVSNESYWSYWSWRCGTMFQLWTVISITKRSASLWPLWMTAASKMLCISYGCDTDTVWGSLLQWKLTYVQKVKKKREILCQWSFSFSFSDLSSNQDLFLWLFVAYLFLSPFLNSFSFWSPSADFLCTNKGPVCRI